MVTPAPDSTSFGTFREIRLGLVCYGGVSLAIYMHGMTKELQKLVIASRALEEGTVPREGTAEHIYWQVLREIQDRSPDGVRPSVVIDVVAGTSAGGINGVILCKALAHNLSQDALRDLWFERGDIKELLGGSYLKGALHLGEFVRDLFRNQAHGPLGGQDMLGWLLQALDDMDGTHGYEPEGSPPPASLMPDGHALQLFVTTTDYYGYRQHMTIADPPTVSERRNRQVLAFRYEPGEGVDRFSPRYNGALAFASRATSSFPGAFPPIQLADLKKLPHARRLPAEIESQLFRSYQLEGAEAAEDLLHRRRRAQQLSLQAGHRSHRQAARRVRGEPLSSLPPARSRRRGQEPHRRGPELLRYSLGGPVEHRLGPADPRGAGRRPPLQRAGAADRGARGADPRRHRGHLRRARRRAQALSRRSAGATRGGRAAGPAGETGPGGGAARRLSLRPLPPDPRPLGRRAVRRRHLPGVRLPGRAEQHRLPDPSDHRLLGAGTPPDRQRGEGQRAARAPEAVRPRLHPPAFRLRPPGGERPLPPQGQAAGAPES